MVDVRGERRLLAAVIQRTIFDAAGIGLVYDYSQIDRDRLQSEAYQWINAYNPELTAAPYTFPWICEHLNVDPDLVREHLNVLIAELKKDRRYMINAKSFGYSYSLIDRMFDDQQPCVNMGNR